MALDTVFLGDTFNAKYTKHGNSICITFTNADFTRTIMWLGENGEILHSETLQIGAILNLATSGEQLSIICQENIYDNGAFVLTAQGLVFDQNRELIDSTTIFEDVLEEDEYPLWWSASYAHGLHTLLISTQRPFDQFLTIKLIRYNGESGSLVGETRINRGNDVYGRMKYVSLPDGRGILAATVHFTVEELRFWAVDEYGSLSPDYLSFTATSGQRVYEFEIAANESAVYTVFVESSIDHDETNGGAYAAAFTLDQLVTAPDSPVRGRPVSYDLSAYPNPFNPSTTIDFTIAESDFVTLRVTDILGREVAELINERLTPGAYSHTWNATSSFGSPLPSGIYFVNLISGANSTVQKLVLMR